LSGKDLLRLCERATPDRGDACMLFWTLGGNQVGKAASPRPIPATFMASLEFPDALFGVSDSKTDAGPWQVT